jgi:hypothetical protein
MNIKTTGNGRQTAQNLKTLRARKDEITPPHVAVFEAVGSISSFLTRLASCTSQSSYQGTAKTEEKEERFVMNEKGKWVKG